MLILPGMLPLSFSLSPGEMAVLLTPKEELSARLARLLLGLERLVAGEVAICGQSPAQLPPKDLRQLRQRIGLLQGMGGLVSNLKVWENLTLPLYYHGQAGHQDIESVGLPLLNRVGYSGRLMELPGHLSLFQKKQIGLARAVITTPDLVIYESPEQGLNLEERAHFFRLIRQFHHERTGRTSLILSCHPENRHELPEATVIIWKEGQQL